jgi:uncharacterized NAD(P)/FAD-binding protein YdhS
VRALVQNQMLHPHPLGLGVAVDANCQITNHQNVPLPGLYTLGPLCSGQFWETTAVPEIRSQAQRLADRIAICTLGDIRQPIYRGLSPIHSEAFP